MTRIAIKGLGLCGGFGTGVDDFRTARAAGSVAPGSLTVPTAAGPVELPAFRAATDRLEDFVPRKTLRRIDNYSKLGLLGGYLALADGGMLEGDRSRMGVIIASGYGATGTTFAFLDSIINDGDICASPTHFANSVHNAAAANLSIQLGAKGPSLTVSQFGMSVPSALATARQWLQEERVDTVLFGGVDELSDLIGYLWHRGELGAGAGAAVMGEGAAFMLLARSGECGAAYCAIDEIIQVSSRRALPPLPAGHRYITGQDPGGHAGYRELLPAAAAITSCSGLYGSLPVGMAFDIAAAALSVADTPLAPPVSCLSLEGDDNCGLVTVSSV